MNKQIKKGEGNFHWCNDKKIYTLLSSVLFKSLTIQVIGTDGVPDYKDRGNFPFTLATIQEALWITTVGRLLKT